VRSFMYNARGSGSGGEENQNSGREGSTLLFAVKPGGVGGLGGRNGTGDYGGQGGE
jgi:hypothetical protein